MEKLKAEYAAQQTLNRVMRFVNRPFTEEEQRQALVNLLGQSTRPYGKPVGRVFDSPVTFTARERIPELNASLCDWAEKPPSLVQKQAFIDGFLGRVTIEPEALDDRTDGSRYEEATRVGTIYVNTAQDFLPEDLEADCKRLGYVVESTVDPREIERVAKLVTADAKVQREQHLDQLRDIDADKSNSDWREAYYLAVKDDTELTPLWGRGEAPPLQKLERDLKRVLKGLRYQRLQARFLDREGNHIRSFAETSEE
jgi:hypothetical protein